MTKFIITVHRPELTEEERARRMKEIEKAAIDLILSVEQDRKKEKA